MRFAGSGADQQQREAAAPKSESTSRAAVQAGARRQPVVMPAQHLAKPGREADLRIQETLDTNIGGYLRMARAALPHLKRGCCLSPAASARSEPRAARRLPAACITLTGGAPWTTAR